jgi:hypothetical protein
LVGDCREDVETTVGQDITYPRCIPDLCWCDGSVVDVEKVDDAVEGNVRIPIGTTNISF